jgi:hypothetical protein
LVAFFVSLVSIVAFDPREVGGRGAAFKEVCGSFKVARILDADPSDVFPGAKVVGESIDDVQGIREYYQWTEWGGGGHGLDHRSDLTNLVGLVGSRDSECFVARVIGCEPDPASAFGVEFPVVVACPIRVNDDVAVLHVESAGVVAHCG